METVKIQVSIVVIGVEILKFDFVFVILVYRSYDDVLICIKSIKEKFSSYKIIIVNSYYDDLSLDKLNRLAKDNACDFLNVENRGYSYGNNQGIIYAKSRYDFNYLIVTNPDIVVQKNRMNFAKYNGKALIIAPEIRTITGKYQNPYWAIKSSIAEFFIYYGYKKLNKLYIYIGIAIHKLIRELFLIIPQNNKKIYGAHGCFMVFSKQALDILGVPFDDKMFLFAEEALLAHKLENENIPIIYTLDISILHKEDGSINLSDIDESNITRKSVIYYYEKYVMGNN